MAEIKLTIPNTKLDRVVDATKFLFKIPQINVGTEESPVMENEFTDNERAIQWRKRKQRKERCLISRKYRQAI